MPAGLRPVAGEIYTWEKEAWWFAAVGAVAGGKKGKDKGKGKGKRRRGI